MKYWRLGTNTSDEMAKVLEAQTWQSRIDRDLKSIAEGDRVVLTVLKGKGEGYWAAGIVTRGMYESGGDLPFSIALDLERVRESAVPSAKVTPILKQARLRVRYLPLFVQELSPAEFQVMLRFI